MKKLYQSEPSLQQITYQLHKLTQQQQRITKITQKFASINRNLLQKTHLDTTTSHQHVGSASKLANIEQKIDFYMRKCEQNITKYKDRLQSVKSSQAKMETSFRQKLNNNKQKLKNIKLRFNANLYECRYKHEQTIVKVQQEFQKIMQKTKQNKYLFDQKILQKNTMKLSAKLDNQLQELRTISHTIEVQESKSKEAIIIELETKLAELRQKLKKNESFHQQTLTSLNDKIDIMKEEFNTQLNEERAQRQENKEKLLTLLQTNLASYLDKSLK